MDEATLEIRLLGELELLHGGRRVALPASKKTRALLGYLVTSGRPHSRQHLCDLLWEGPDDPRAAVRWSLTKIRPLVDDEGVPRLLCDRDHVGFEAKGAVIDLPSVRAAVEGRPERAATEALVRAASRFRGELLEGLDLPDCYRYHEWCVAERESVRALRLSILEALVDRFRGDPEEALRYARERAGIDPLSEAAHIALIRLLGDLGRTREALRQYETCRRILENELGTRPSGDLERARMALRPSPAPLASAAPKARPPSAASPALVGRASERALLSEALAGAAAGRCGEVLLAVGEPGIGKTRLLDELGVLGRAAGGLVLMGRAFEAEMVRPYGAWIDALRSVALGERVGGLRSDLAPLLPELGPSPPAAGDRTRLFDAVARLLGGLGAAGAPAAVILDDIHWLDEASAALLHYVARSLGPSHVLLACAARPGELADNAAALRLVRALGRERRLQELALEPLGADETARLARALAPEVDGERVFAESRGNPLFALEVARALKRGGSALSDTLGGLIGERLSRLDEPARGLVPWAAALGRRFDLETLARVTGTPAAEVLGAVEDLERRGILRVIPSLADEGGYDFSHDLVRQVAYCQLSEPRRRLVHLQIARALHGMPDPDGALAGDVAHHAALGGDSELGVTSSLAAGERCLRVYAHAEAAELARFGIQHVQRLPREARLRLHMELLKLFVHSGAGRDREQEVGTEISRLILECQSAGLHAQVQTGFYLIAFLNYYGGDFAVAREGALRAAEAGRAADPATAARALANTGRCLLLLERDLPRATALLGEAETLARQVGIEATDIPWGLGLVEYYSGDHAAARRHLERALVLARRAEDHWAECECLWRLVMIALEAGRPEAGLVLCRDLVTVAAKMGEGSEAPFAAALTAVAGLALGEAGANERFEAALSALRAIDSKWMLAYALTLAAETDLAAGRRDLACRRAEEALAAARAVGRPSEAVVARSLLAGVALASGDREGAARHVDASREDLAGGASARARATLARVAGALGVPIPTPPPTPAPTPRP